MTKKWECSGCKFKARKFTAVGSTNDEVVDQVLAHFRKVYPQVFKNGGSIDDIRDSITNNIKDLGKIKQAREGYPALFARLLKSPKAVKKLNLSRKKLSFIPAEIGKLVNLRNLNLAFNPLRSLPPEIGRLKNLAELNISGSFIIRSPLKTLPGSFRQLQNLKKLDMSFNTFTMIPAVIFKLQKLEELNLKGNNIKVIPREIGRLANLKKLDLRYNKIPVKLKYIENQGRNQ